MRRLAIYLIVDNRIMSLWEMCCCGATPMCLPSHGLTGNSAQGGKNTRERGEISGEETIFRLTSRSGRDLPFEWTSPRILI